MRFRSVSTDSSTSHCRDQWTTAAFLRSAAAKEATITCVVGAIAQERFCCNKLLPAIVTIKAHPLPFFPKPSSNLGQQNHSHNWNAASRISIQTDRLGINNKEQVCSALQIVYHLFDTKIRGTRQRTKCSLSQLQTQGRQPQQKQTESIWRGY